MKGYIGLPFAPGSMTSREAALKGLKTCENLREDIWLVLRGEGPPGATAEEIGNMLMLSGNTVRPRLIELQALGRIDLTRNTRKTRSGRKAFTYRAIHPDLWTNKEPGWPTVKRQTNTEKLRQQIRRLKGEIANLEAELEALS